MSEIQFPSCEEAEDVAAESEEAPLQLEELHRALQQMQQMQQMQQLDNGNSQAAALKEEDASKWQRKGSTASTSTRYSHWLWLYVALHLVSWLDSLCSTHFLLLYGFDVRIPVKKVHTAKFFFFLGMQGWNFGKGCLC